MDPTPEPAPNPYAAPDAPLAETGPAGAYPPRGAALVACVLMNAAAAVASGLALLPPFLSLARSATAGEFGPKERAVYGVVLVCGLACVATYLLAAVGLWFRKRWGVRCHGWGVGLAGLAGMVTLFAGGLFLLVSALALAYAVTGFVLALQTKFHEALVPRRRLSAARRG